MSSDGIATLLQMHILCFFWRKNLSNLLSRLIFISFWPRGLFKRASKTYLFVSPFEDKKTLTKSKKRRQFKEYKLMMTKIFRKVLARGHGHFYNLVFAHFFIFRIHIFMGTNCKFEFYGWPSKAKLFMFFLDIHYKPDFYCEFM